MFQRTAFGKCLGFRNIVLGSPAKEFFNSYRIFAHRRAPFVAQNPTRLRHPTALLPPGLLDEGGGGTEGGGRKTQPEPERSYERKPTSILVAELVLEWSSSLVFVSSGTRSRSRSSGRSGSFSRRTPDTQPEHPSRPPQQQSDTCWQASIFYCPSVGHQPGRDNNSQLPSRPRSSKMKTIEKSQFLQFPSRPPPQQQNESH